MQGAWPSSSPNSPSESARSFLSDAPARRPNMHALQVIALSVDSLPEHRKWIPVRLVDGLDVAHPAFLAHLQDIDEINQCTVNYPIVADHDRKVVLQSSLRVH